MPAVSTSTVPGRVYPASRAPTSRCTVAASSAASRGVGTEVKVATANEQGGYSITGLELALLLNFKSTRLEWKRVIRQQNRGSDPPDLHS